MTVEHLKEHAIGGSLFRPTTLSRAVQRLGFVQADPIRSPARAQDLILRHRVKNYRAGDLEKRYASLGLEEDFLYAYGFMARRVWEDLHPRLERNLTAVERRVLVIVIRHKRIHPRELEAYFGRERQVNAWGGYSKATTRILHSLHYRGLLRVAGRENGIRLYEMAEPAHVAAHSHERLGRLVLVVAGILAPVPVASLRSALALLGRGAPSLPGRRTIVTELLGSGDLQGEVVDGVHYLWPSGHVSGRKPEDVVRFLAPFDPVVWDRRRFEHLWGWPYRFEAYTPLARRRLGYYAMPMLWRNDVVGWVNISNMKGNYRVETGFAKAAISIKPFRSAFDAEVERFRGFLQPRDCEPEERKPGF
jgi:uncharacterized protein YcaQ